MGHNNNDVKRLSRRDMLKYSAVTAAIGASSGLWLPASAQVSSQPKKGGLLRLGLAGANITDSFDPGSWVDSFAFVAFSTVHNSLVEIDQNGLAVPELAESWEHSADVKRWTFKLRQGVVFHNGKSMTAEDVVASIEHHLGEQSTSAAKSVLGDIAAVRAKGKDAVVIELHRGNVDFPYVMADYHVVIIPSKDGLADWRSGMGAGGYQIKSFEPGVRMQLVRNPNYWKQGRAHFAEAQLLGINEPTARVNALVSGAVDAINRVDLKTVALLERNPNLSIEETIGAQHCTFPMLCDREPFKDNNLRLAMKHAIDRKALLSTVLRGHGQIGNDHPIQASNRFINKDLPQRPYDADKARFYLKQAELERFTIKLHASDAAYAGAVDAAVLFKEHARAAGIEIEVVREPADGFFSNVWMKQPLCTSYFYSSLTADRMFSIGYAQGAGWNETYWAHPRFNQLLEAARGETNEPLRREMYYEMQQLCRDQGGAIIPLFTNSIAARSKRVMHSGKTAPWGEMDGLRLVERWWQA